MTRSVRCWCMKKRKAVREYCDEVLTSTMGETLDGRHQQQHEETGENRADYEHEEEVGSAAQDVEHFTPFYRLDRPGHVATQQAGREQRQEEDAHQRRGILHRRHLADERESHRVQANLATG